MNPDDPTPRLRAILVKAGDDHIVRADDSIEVPCRGLTSSALACNVHGAVGLPAIAFNSAGLQVWTPRVMEVRSGRIVRREVTAEEAAAYWEGRDAA